MIGAFKMPRKVMFRGKMVMEWRSFLYAANSIFVPSWVRESLRDCGWRAINLVQVCVGLDAVQGEHWHWLLLGSTIKDILGMNHIYEANNLMRELCKAGVIRPIGRYEYMLTDEMKEGMKRLGYVPPLEDFKTPPPDWDAVSRETSSNASGEKGVD